MKGTCVHLAMVSLLVLAELWPAGIPALASRGPSTSSTWYTTNLDLAALNDGGHYFNASVAVDSQDRLHMGYRGPDLSLRYATNSDPDGLWSIESVYSAPGVSPYDISLDVDEADLPHISFSSSDGSHSDLMYAWKTAGGWITELVTTSDTIGLYGDLALDSNGLAHISLIAHSDGGPYYLMYSTNASGGWVTTPMGLALWDRTSIGVDYKGVVHIVYMCVVGTKSGVCHYTNRDDARYPRIIDSAGWSPSMAVDSQGKIHIVYGRGAADLWYATNASGPWARQVIAASVSPGHDSSIAVDAANHPHVTYHAANTGGLTYCNNVSGPWTCEVTDPDQGAGEGNSIAVDSSSGVHMSYRYLGTDHTTLRYATTSPAACMPSIEFTYVPPYGSFDNLQGRVHCVEPAHFKIVVFIKVLGSWWIKPTYANPLTPIQADGTWVTDITTGGDDQLATWIAAFLVPNGYIPPPIGGQPQLPDYLFHDTVAHLVIERPAVYRYIDFAGHTWAVKASVTPIDPGPCPYSDTVQDVWVDDQGRLHLSIHQHNGQWYCTEVFATDVMGYGTYTFYTASRVDLIDRNIVLGLFTWDDNAPDYHYRELDVEMSRWGVPDGPNAQFVVQPWNWPNHRHQFTMNLLGDDSLHTFTWAQGSVAFASYQGHTWPPNPGDLIEAWSHTHDDIPPAGQGNARMNLWLYNGSAPSDGQPVEVIIEWFAYQAP